MCLVSNIVLEASDDAFDYVEQCHKSHVKKQTMLKYADMVVRDMPLLTLCKDMQYVNKICSMLIPAYFNA
jgi:hypothetical protein